MSTPSCSTREVPPHFLHQFSGEIQLNWLLPVCIVHGFKGTMGDSDETWLSRVRVLLLKHIDDWPSSLGVGVIRLEDAATIPRCDAPHGRSHASGEDFGVKCTCHGIIVLLLV